MTSGTPSNKRSNAAGMQAGGRIPPLDGFRAAFVFSVMAFHLWQQSWLTPTFTLFGHWVSLDPFLRTGYLWVDGLLLLSGFLLYLPTARAAEAGRALPGFSGFYTRRAWRIVPTYLLNLLVVFLVVALPEKRYATFWAAARDWLAHLSFTHPFFAFSSINTPLNGALWTVGVEVQFYLLFPLIARAFRRLPLVTYVLLGAVAFLFRAHAIQVAQSPMLVNQLPAFLDVYLNGFVAAMVYARLERRGRDGGPRRILFSAAMLVSALGLMILVNRQAALRAISEVRAGQLRIRYLQSVLSAIMLLGGSLGLGGVRWLLGNRVAGFLAAISYQVYLWHQVIALQLKKWRVPDSASPNPHMTGDRRWQVAYVLLVCALTLLISWAVTFFIEQPLYGLPGRARGSKAEKPGNNPRKQGEGQA